MSHVKFLETRRYRAPGGSKTLKYARGQTYPFQAYMQPFIDIGHAVLIEGVDATPAPAPVEAMPPSAMARDRKPKAAAEKPASALSQSMERSVPVPATLPTPRDPVKNGGFSEA